MTLYSLRWLEHGAPFLMSLGPGQIKWPYYHRHMLTESRLNCLQPADEHAAATFWAPCFQLSPIGVHGNRRDTQQVGCYDLFHFLFLRELAQLFPTCCETVTCAGQSYSSSALK